MVAELLVLFPVFGITRGVAGGAAFGCSGVSVFSKSANLQIPFPIGVPFNEGLTVAVTAAMVAKLCFFFFVFFGFEEIRNTGTTESTPSGHPLVI